MLLVVKEKEKSEWDQIESEGTEKMNADMEYQWRRREDREARLKLIEDGVGESYAAAANRLILVWSDFDFDPMDGDGEELAGLTSKMSTTQVKQLGGTKLPWDQGEKTVRLTVW